MKFFKIILIIFISLTSSIKADSQKKLINELKEGGKIIFIRHAYAPGNGDPENFDKKDCSTQRNLNIEGIEQSKKIGQFFIKNQIILNEIFTSEWCRCKDTAKYAFDNFKTFDALNSFYQAKFIKNKDKQIKDLKKFIKTWDDDKNLILITHYVVISEMLGVGVSSGEIIVSDKNYNIIDSIEIGY
tara:strand:- start:585 stop:1142 length:558 start_codon:yes stop_codon:yes gene_type:complete